VVLTWRPSGDNTCVATAPEATGKLDVLPDWASGTERDPERVELLDGPKGKPPIDPTCNKLAPVRCAGGHCREPALGVSKGVTCAGVCNEDRDAGVKGADVSCKGVEPGGRWAGVTGVATPLDQCVESASVLPMVPRGTVVEPEAKEVRADGGPVDEPP